MTWAAARSPDAPPSNSAQRLPSRSLSTIAAVRDGDLRVKATASSHAEAVDLSGLENGDLGF
jgi:hypothetical protein